MAIYYPIVIMGGPETCFVTAMIMFIGLEAVAAQRATVGTNMGGWLVLEPWITPSSVSYTHLRAHET